MNFQNFIIQSCNNEHILIAGTTGSGKSTLLKSICYYLLHRGIRFDIIDLKKVSLIEYRRLSDNGLNTYADTVAEAEKVLNYADAVINKRYAEMLREGIDKSRRTPYYIIIDEAADLLDGVPKIKPTLIHLLRLGRAANVRLIFATQSPDRKTIPSQLQQNITTTFALRCRSTLESRQIIGIKGAELLSGAGYALYCDNHLDRPELIHIEPRSLEDIQELVKLRLDERKKL